MRLVYVALAAALILAGCSKDSESPNVEQDSGMATGTTGQGKDRQPNQAADPYGTGPDGNVEDGAKPPTTGK